MQSLRSRISSVERARSPGAQQVVFSWRPWRGDPAQPVAVGYGGKVWRQEAGESPERFKERVTMDALEIHRSEGHKGTLYLDARPPSLTRTQWLERFAANRTSIS